MSTQPASAAPNTNQDVGNSPRPRRSDSVDASVATDAAKPFNTETYDVHHENGFLSARQNPLSTFSIDVDTAATPIVRRFLNAGPAAADGTPSGSRSCVNYFPYDYAAADRATSRSRCNVEVGRLPLERRSTGWPGSA